MSITPESAKALLTSDNFGERIQGINQLREIAAADAFELLPLVLNDRNERVRYAAVSLLSSVGQVDREQARELLQVALRDTESDVKAAAADSIAGLKLRECYSDLRELYQETTDWIIRFSIVAALGELGEPEGFEILEHAIQSGDVLLVPAAVGAMGDLGDPRAIPYLLPQVENADWQIRLRVLQALQCFDTPEAKAAIATLAQDTEPQIAEQAKQILG